jgi:hypothetical protein
MSDRNNDAEIHTTWLAAGEPLKEIRHAFTPS